MQENIAPSLRFAPRQVLGYAIQATAFAPLVGMGSLEWLRLFGLTVPDNLRSALLGVGAVWVLWFALAVMSHPQRRRSWGAFRVLSDPKETAGAKLRVMVRDPWGIAMLVMFAAGIASFIITVQ